MALEEEAVEVLLGAKVVAAAAGTGEAAEAAEMEQTGVPLRSAFTRKS